MRGNGGIRLIADNLNAVNPLLEAKYAMNRKPRLCWKCQKPKQTKGGHITMYPGLLKFICKECMDAKAKAKENK